MVFRSGMPKVKDESPVSADDEFAAFESDPENGFKSFLV
jgi:hypothetical protein